MATRKPDPRKFSHEGYHAFSDGEGGEYGSFEVFYAEPEPDSVIESAGWYWWACFPGCLPDGEPCGPFTSSRAAYRDAREG